eukprot:m.251987 g.251987  ORF g.251987 m.251987 type:complete len:626 (+) comp40342_c0_seq3:77-1954(+)
MASVQGGPVTLRLVFLLFPFIFLGLPQPSTSQCNVTFTGSEANGNRTFQVEAHYYKISDECGGGPVGESVAIWARRESGSGRWIGVGSSTDGTMCGADMFTGHISLDDPTKAVLVDSGSTKNEKPVADGNETAEEVTVKELAMEDGKMVLRFVRPVMPNDPDDAHFNNDLKLMLATGYVFQSDEDVDGEIFYHGSNRKMSDNEIDLTTCIGCPCMEPIENGRFQFSNVLKYVPGTEVTFYCDGGYALVGDAKLTCGSDGQWVGSKPSCQPLFQSTKCSVTGYREHNNEDTKYTVRWGIPKANEYSFELTLYANDHNWVGVGMQMPENASNGMCGADIVTAHLSRNGSLAKIEDRNGQSSGRPQLDTSQISNDLPRKDGTVNSDGKARFFFSLLPSGWTAGSRDVDPGMAHHFLVASGYVAEDDQNADGTIVYHQNSRMMFNKTGWRDVCAACPLPTLNNGHPINPDQLPYFFLNDQISFGCNRFYELKGPETARCEMKNGQGAWSGEAERTCELLATWNTCSMTGCGNSSDPYSCIDARWMFNDNKKSLTVEIKRPVKSGKNYWVGFGFSSTPTMCGADTTIAFFSLKDGHCRWRTEILLCMPGQTSTQTRLKLSIRADTSKMDK